MYTICRSKWLQLSQNNWCMRFSQFTIRFPFICVVTNVVNRNRHTYTNMCNVHCIHVTQTNQYVYAKNANWCKFSAFEMPKMQFSLLSLVTLLFGHYFVNWMGERGRERNKTQNFKLNLYCSHLYTVRILTIISRVQYYKINAIDKIIYKMWDIVCIVHRNPNAFSCTHEFLSKSALSLYLSLSHSLFVCARASISIY